MSLGDLSGHRLKDHAEWGCGNAEIAQGGKRIGFHLDRGSALLLLRTSQDLERPREVLPWNTRTARYDKRGHVGTATAAALAVRLRT